MTRNVFVLLREFNKESSSSSSDPLAEATLLMPRSKKLKEMMSFWQTLPDEFT